MQRILSFFIFAILAFAHLPSAANSNVIPVLTIRDSINVGVSEHILSALKKAEKDKHPALIIQLDTPGGFLEATRDIVKAMLNSDMPIVVWVSPQGSRAASAGAMITMAAHYAAMAPSTSIGAATPVSGGGKDVAKDMKQKIQNDTLSFVEGIARKRDRNIEWARKTVSEAASLEASQALKIGAIDGVHSDIAEVWSATQAKYPELPQTVSFQYWDFELKDKVLSFFSNPNVAYGLMALGALGIYMEMTNPGTMVPGAIGAVALALGAISLKIVPVQNGALILFLVGLILIAIEVFVPAATFGVAGASGGAALILSGIFLIDPEQSNLSINLQIWIPIFIVFGAFCTWLGIAAARSLKAKGVDQGVDALIGKDCEVLKVISSKKAQARIAGEIWNIKWDPKSSKNLEFQKGQSLTVVKQKGFTAFVKEKM